MQIVSYCWLTIAGILAANYFVYLSLISIQRASVGSPLALSLDANLMLAAQTEPALALESRPMAEECTVRLCRTWEELKQFGKNWNRLLANPASSKFQTPEWLAAYGGHLPRTRN